MTSAPAAMKLLLTNDDGINAPGLRALWESVHEALSDRPVEVIVVAPDRGRSECGHSVTTQRPLVVNEQRPGWFAVDGTPVDCIRVALTTLVPDVDAAFSGVNAGANLGVDLVVSGTFAAAREAALHGLPAMAISHYRHPAVPKTWDHVPRWLRATLREFVDMLRARTEARCVEQPGCFGKLWNVNLPAIDPEGQQPARIWCDVDPSPLQRTGHRLDDTITFEVDFHRRPRLHHHDVDHCFSGGMTLTSLNPLMHSHSGR